MLSIKMCASNSHRSYSSSRRSFRWAAVRCEPDRRCWCTRPLPDAASWWPRTWTESLPRCTDHTYTGSECRCIPRSDTRLPTSARTRTENAWAVPFSVFWEGRQTDGCLRSGGESCLMRYWKVLLIDFRSRRFHSTKLHLWFRKQ